ncbi:eCIS core domain-containing protein [Bradyrhizobium iriomotense]|uniref:eCIS core domain-containing protein n=1 Tax=Bradyrhizobium iriomotense TaxID=441950 RepID=A0ABQ6B5S8_9BRAD|nr:DUF4157 domain-containing protein [Bradyrhizobium iriomotense]GLR87966.1 hypothetical protein GCM10007857_46780 [Bradyrhizobium iriomotense]
MQSFVKLARSANRSSSVRPPPRVASIARGQQLVMRSACACGGTCPRCAGEEFDKLQPKLTVNEPGDAFEREADRVADHIVSGVAPPLTEAGHGSSRIQRMCADCEDEEELQLVQRKIGSGADIAISPGTQSYIQSMTNGGAALSGPEAQYYESRFGRSFGDVRIHTGGAADRAAKSINARAFTIGSNIAFADGEHDFASTSGRRLMAHELTHTVQQSAGVGYVQRGSSGLFGGKCCNPAMRVEWALVGDGVWKKLEPGDCTGALEDCDGMTCGGGFYRVEDRQGGSCSTPHHDDATFTPRRWTPSAAGPNAHSPTAEGSKAGDTPPNYVYDSASTAQCPNGVRTISVDFVTLAGATTSAATELAAANRLFSSCCIRFVTGATPPRETLATTQGWLGGDTDLSWSTGCASVTAEEKAMWDGGMSSHGLSSRMRVYLVDTMTPNSAAGYSTPPFCATGPAAPYVNHVVLSNAVTNTINPLAHEFGHILLNSGDHTTAPNLMGASGGTVLSPTDCATCYANA